MSDSQQSKRAEEAKRNPPDESTHTERLDREDVPSEREVIDVPTEDEPPEVAQEGGNPVARLIRRLRRR